MAHKFNPDHIEKLLKPERVKETEPVGLLGSIGLGVGSTLADIGCGPGFFTLPASVIVGAGGLVYALDTEPKMLDAIKKQNPPDNVTLLVSTEHELPIDDSSCTHALLAYMFHEVEEPLEFLAEVRRVLEAWGRVAIIDWDVVEEERGPPIHERIEPATVAALLFEAGFTDPEITKLNASHYMVTAAK
jgi:ubiquinone/menaquinone biosynthesis C-methylase UbiE